MRILASFLCLLVLPALLSAAEASSASAESSSLPSASSSMPAAPESGGRLLDTADLTTLALTNNQELLQALLNHRKALLDVDSARSGYYPKIDMQISFTRIGNPIAPIVIQKGQFGKYDIGGQTVDMPPNVVRIYEGQEDLYYQFKLSLQQPLFTWGKIDNAVKLYGEVAAMKELLTRKKDKEIRTRVTILVSSLYWLRQIEDVIAAQKKASERLIYISEQSYSNGFIVYTDLLNAKIQVKELDVAALKVQEASGQALLDLQQTTELHSLSIGDLDFKGVFTNPSEVTVESREALFSNVQRTSLDLELLTKMKTLSALQLDIAKAQVFWKPDIALVSDLSYAGPRFPFIEQDWGRKDDYNFNLSLAFQSHLFDGGKNDTDIKIKEQEITNSRLEYNQGKNKIEKFISETLLKLSLNRDNIEYYRLKVENGRAQMGQKKTQFENGSGGEADVVKEELNMYKDTIGYYQELVDFFKNYYMLQAVM